MLDINLDRAGAVNDNAAALKKRATQGGGKHKGGVAHGAGKGVPHEHQASKGPVATALPGTAHILDLAHHPGARHHGESIAGIIRTTTTGNDLRNYKLLSGILDMSEHGRKADGPVHSVTGHDATARNAGYRPIPGSPFH